MKLTREQRLAARAIDGIKALRNLEAIDCGSIVYDHFFKKYLRANNGDPDGRYDANLLYAVMRFAAMVSGKGEPIPPKVGW